MRYTLIINSRNNPSNQSRLEDAIYAVAEKNPALRSRMDLRYTEYAGHARDIALEVDSRFGGSAAVVACGGDGTMHEIASALAFRKTPVIAVPFGTGNDFVKTVNPEWKKWSFEDYLTGLDDVHYRLIDLIRADSFDLLGNFIPVWSSFFNNVASIGLDTKVQANAKAMVAMKDTAFVRNTAYVRSALKAIFSERTNRFRYSLELEDGRVVEGESDKYTLMSICNAKYYGDGFTPAPEAVIDDGFADVCVVDDVSTLKALSLILKYRSGKHVGKDGIHMYKATSGVIKSCDPSMQLPGNFDGEDFFGTTLRFEVCPGALKLGVFSPKN